MVIKGCKLFEKKKAGRYSHSITLDHEHEEMLACIMLHDHRTLANAIERGIEMQFKQYSKATRAETMAYLSQMQEEDA